MYQTKEENLAHEIVELFEEFLDERGIKIENPDKQQDENAANIYGLDYADLFYGIQDLISKYKYVEFILSLWHTIIKGGMKMNVNTNNLVSITEANQNFSKVARLVDENGPVVILKNNVPKYVVIEFDQVATEQIAGDEDVKTLSKRLMEKNRKAYEVLAK